MSIVRQLRVSNRCALPCLFSNQVRFYYKPNDGVLPRRESRRTLSKTHRELAKPSGDSSKTILLPPFVGPGELRILLGIDYKSALSLCQVKLFQQKYYWSDLEGRYFETSNKRKVLVPYDLIAPSLKLFGYTPVLVDPEPTIPSSPESGRIPAVALVHASSDWRPYGTLISNPAAPRTEQFNQTKLTVLPVGPDASRAMQGRTVVNADLTVVVGDDVAPALLDLINERRILRVPSDTGKDAIIRLVSESLASMVTPALPSADTPPQYPKERKRTDVLVDCEKPPIASGVILDVEKSMQQGTTALVLVKAGMLKIGQNFVAGSGYGKVTNMWAPVDGAPLQFATAGMVVKLGRLVKDADYTGDFAPDDYLHVFPRERAWRLAFHRQRIEWLNTFQTDGKKLRVQFELDSNLDNSRSFTDMDDSTVRVEPAVRSGGSVGEIPDYRKIRERKRLLEAMEGSGSILVEPVAEEEDAVTRRARVESAKVTTRQSRREEMRLRAKLEEMDRQTTAKREAYKLRHMGHHGVDISVDTPGVVERTHTEDVGAPLPQSVPVIPLIVKTRTVSEFDALLDELELLETQFGMKLPVVQGGIGPVTPNDLVHAEIEAKFSPCPVYSMGVDVLPQCRSDVSEVIRFESVGDVVSEIRSRILRVKRISNRNSYKKSLVSK